MIVCAADGNGNGDGDGGGAACLLQFVCAQRLSAYPSGTTYSYITKGYCAPPVVCAFLLSFLSCLRGQRSGYYFYPLDPRDPARPAGRSKVTPWHRQWPKEETRWSSDRLSQR